MQLVTDKSKLAAYLNKHAQVNVYQLGDLDDLYWDSTTWYAAIEQGDIKAIVLLYKGLEPPILLAIDNHNHAHMTNLLEEVFELLPKKIYAHISPNLITQFGEKYQLTDFGEHHKMALVDTQAMDNLDTTRAQIISAQDTEQLIQFYDHSYPAHSFHQSMLASGHYWSVRENLQIVCVAGVHVFSTKYRVAALGNIVTHPDQRGKGWGTIATAAVCKDLLAHTDALGLNVKVDNRTAIHLYQKLGFEVVANYHEYLAVKK